MNQVSVLDCTLRDGGYVNEFKFGNQQISDIITLLSRANIDMVECGFLRSGASDLECTLFDSVEAIAKVIKQKKPGCTYVAMIQYGAISLDEISENKGDSIDGIRLTFHEQEIDEVFDFAEGLADKGYQVFIQPVGTTTYKDENLLHLIKLVNKLHPIAFYIVDTLGTMYKRDLRRLFYEIDHNLDKGIAIGFHSHNNLQMSFANAQEFIQLKGARKIIIDASVLGMGRGAGNLNTELITQFLNVNYEYNYDQLEIMKILDGYIRPLLGRFHWGYEAAYYIAAVAMCHPNYASYLLNLQTINIQSINRILKSLPLDKRSIYDKAYIQKKYREYMDHHVDDEKDIERLLKLIDGRKVLLMAPGKSLRDNTDKIIEYKNEGYFLVSINAAYSDVKPDLIYISNMKRFQNLNRDEIKDIPIVLTSNIQTDKSDIYFIVNYSDYLNEDYDIMDNAGLMCLNLLERVNVKEVILAGFDGFSADGRKNYYKQDLYLSVDEERLINMNEAIKRRIKQLRLHFNLSFIGNSIYEE